MNQVVLQKNAQEIAKMKEYYDSNLTGKTPQGGVFTAKTNHCTITAYRSGKVLFQGAGCQEEARRWGAPGVKQNSNSTAARKTKAVEKRPGAGLPANISSLSVIGSDEVGTGDFFGPITVCAAYVKKEEIPLLHELGVQDSKNLNDEKISAIAKQIIKIIPYSLLVLPNEKYNSMQKTGMSQGKMKALLHNQAILHLLKKIAPEKPEAILIDQFAKEEIYYGYLKGQKNIQRENVCFSTKAEGIHTAVAAASIIARYAFVQHFEKLSVQAGFKIPKGAGAQVDAACARLIKEKGKEVLPAYVKLHFANTDKAFNILRRK
ncbi:ribonuclease HIII [Bacillus benzoevorans]|uniref:Ribonuclease HIII n=1 Tax=Bacillus benzoevorans TaxID=1456 RepID=A0A7X0HTY2_9BACI|nr:ribonuclease HIII [Bacillus benzoevorans]MBB6445655.1 ribonuclease HIII [Bacillus benzoevorans]